MDINKLKFEYLDIKTISETAKINARTLRHRITSGKYQVREINSVGGKCGKKYEILFSSLEKELQSKIIFNISNYYPNEDLEEMGQPNSSFYLETSNYLFSNCTATQNNNTMTTAKSSLFLPDKAKKIALAKLDIVSEWNKYRKNFQDKKEADKTFVISYNKGIISDTLKLIIDKISIRSLYRWNNTLNSSNNNYLSLVNEYKYSSESVLSTTLSDEEKQEFIKIYYNDAKLNLSVAYQLVKLKLEKTGCKIKSIATYRRFVNFINRNHNDFAILAREGEKALKDKVAPYNRRDISDISVGDVLVADGNKLDFMVINPFNGRPCRAIWVVFFDWFSFDVAGYEIMLTENTQNISSALRNAIIRLGKIPKKVYMDNGRAFRGNYFKGCDDLNHCGFQGIYSNLGIEQVIAQPYNGRSKVVERFFADFVRSCPPIVSSYIGNSISNKPAHLNRNEKFHKKLHKDDKIPTIQQAKIIIETWLNRYHRVRPCPHDKKHTIAEVFASGVGTGVNIDMLDELMMSSCIRSVSRGAIKLFGLEYESTALYGLKDKFMIKYSLFDISKVKVYSMKNEFICEAKNPTLVKAFAKDGTVQDLYQYRMQQKQYKELIKKTKHKTMSLISLDEPFGGITWCEEQKAVDIEPKRKKKKLEITNYENISPYRAKCELKI